LGSWPVGPQLENYFSDQFKFVESLSNEVRSNLAVRLFPQDFGWEQEKRWLIFDSKSKLLPLSKSLDSYLKDTKLYISTYNATTFLESFKSNIPTVIYWDPKFWEINKNSRPYFNRLKDANIFFDSPEAAALHVNVIWEDVEGWWNSKKVKDAVKIFSETYAYTGSAPLEKLSSAILNWD
jgi:putative transferase (TIGR04331 family)